MKSWPAVTSVYVCLTCLAYMYICFVCSIKYPPNEVPHSLYGVVTMATCCPPPETSLRCISPVSSWNPSVSHADDIWNVALSLCPRSQSCHPTMEPLKVNLHWHIWLDGRLGCVGWAGTTTRATCANRKCVFRRKNESRSHVNLQMLLIEKQF